MSGLTSIYIKGDNAISQVSNNTHSDLVDNITYALNDLIQYPSLQTQQYLDDAINIIQTENLGPELTVLKKEQESNITSLTSLISNPLWSEQLIKLEETVKISTTNFESLKSKLEEFKERGKPAPTPVQSKTILGALNQLLHTNKAEPVNSSNESFRKEYQDKVLSDMEEEKNRFLEQLQNEREVFSSAFVKQLQSKWT